MSYNILQLTNLSVELLRRLIATPSISRDETAAADIIQSYIETNGLKTHRSGNNVWCLTPFFEEGRTTILLNSHIDTVKPVSAWKRDPFTPSMENERLYGLGSNDAGASLVSLLHVFLTLCQQALNYNLIFLASCEEEVSGKNGIESVLPLLPHVDFALVGEPTGMQPAIAEKGLMVIDAVAEGQSGHAARNEGINAVYKALEDIGWIRNYQFPKVSPLLGPVKMTVTIIQAGTQHNVVPDKCSYTIDVRSNECYTNEEIFDIIKAHIQSIPTARSFRLHSSSCDVSFPIVERAIKLGREPFGSPTMSDQALMRFPSMKMGPGQSSRSHTADEYICISEIEDAIELYLQILQPWETNQYK